MRRVGDNHQPDCSSNNTASTCICVPPESMWSHPKDVEVYLEETWEQRLAYVNLRQAAWKSRRV
jgi:hypothetical protein